jgi:hypothetical protein
MGIQAREVLVAVAVVLFLVGVLAFGHTLPDTPGGHSGRIGQTEPAGHDDGARFEGYP